MDSTAFIKWVKKISFGAFVLALVIFSLLPIYFFIVTSLKTEAAALSLPPSYLFFDYTVRNYVRVFTEQPFALYLFNSLAISALTVFFSLVLGAPCAYAFSRLSFRFKEQSMFMILTMRMMPPICLALPFFTMFNELGMMDSRFGLSMVYLSFALPMVIWMMKVFFDAIPISLEEAACIDGASPIVVFWKVALPLVRQGLVTSGILIWVLSWNEFLFAMVLTRRWAKTAPVAINNLMRYQELNWSQVAAGSVSVMAPAVLIALLLRKYLIKGWVSGAVKE